MMVVVILLLKSVGSMRLWMLEFFFDQENSGVSVARNNGLIHASGEYIYFLDSDDTIDPAFLSVSLAIAKQQNFDLVILGETLLFAGPTFDCCTDMRVADQKDLIGHLSRYSLS
jgi:glycosyltransferase involved in cell wall biosynthesis